MIINYSLHGYIWPCWLYVGTFFYSLFSFYPWGWPRCVSTILEILFLPLSWTIGLLCKYVILFMLMLDSLHHAFLWENINNNTLNTSGWNVTTIDPCVAKIYPNLSDGAKKYQQTFLAPLLGMDLKPPYLVIALRNANKHFYSRCWGGNRWKESSRTWSWSHACNGSYSLCTQILLVLFLL